MYRNKDHEAFNLAGIGDCYNRIGSLNLFMQCDSPNADAFRTLPEGYTFRSCRRSELELWKHVVAEKQYIDFVSDFYNKVYIKHVDVFFRHCSFVCTAEDVPVASCLFWPAYGLIGSVGWFRVLPDYEGIGLGRALLSEVLKVAGYPVYLHTQPTSARAVKLYSDFGFKLITDPVVGYLKNDLAESLPFIQKVLPECDYEKLRFTQADDALLKASLTGEYAEF